MTTNAYSIFEAARAEGRKFLLPLADPDKTTDEAAAQLGETATELGLPVILIGGSLLSEGGPDRCIRAVRRSYTGKIILFPGDAMQLSREADGILFLSLISGRNPELLIGRHVTAAPYVRQAGLEAISTGYMLVDCGRQTSASYMSHTFPIPYSKTDIAVCTAIAGEMLGLRCLYLDGGSGAERPVSAEMIAAVAANTGIPLIVGGGLRTAQDAANAAKAGADLLVVGNVLEKSPGLLKEMARALQNP